MIQSKFNLSEYIYKNRIVFLLLFSTFILKISTVQIMGVGGLDATETWQFANKIPYTTQTLFHRSVRFGTIIPVFLTQKLLGLHSVVYFAAPVIAITISTLMLFLTMRKICSEKTALLTSLIFNILPEIMKTGSHPRVTTFTVLYFHITLYLLFLIFEKRNSEKKSFSLVFLIPSLFTFFMYMAKESSLFLLPSLFIFVYSTRKKFIDLAVYAGSLFSLYLVETAIYFFTTEHTLGRLSVIQSHVSSLDNPPVKSITDFFLNRFIPQYNDLYLTILVFISILSTIYLFKKTRDIRIRTIIYAIWSYLLLLTTLPKSINPLIPFHNYKEIYFVLIIPSMTAIIAIALENIYFQIKKTERVDKLLWHNAVIISLFLVITGSLATLTVQKVIFYKNDKYSIFELNGIYQTMHFDKLISNTVDKGDPILLEGRTSGRRFLPVLRQVNELIDQGLTEQEACKEFGIEYSRFKEFQKSFKKIRYTSELIITRFFWKIKYPKITSLPFKEIIVSDMAFRVIFTDGIIRNTNEIKNFIYIPFGPFKVIEFESLESLNDYIKKQ
jgi:hypothetical protein